jgi:two-component system response regulator HupR/HoxA
MSRAGPSDGAKRILIVDDEPLNRELLRRVLQADYAVEEAEDADAAVARLEAAAFDAVLCDQLMPGRTGTELALDARARWPATRFLLITGYDDDPQVRAARATGAVHEVVTKPWTARGLKDILRKLLG